MMNTCPTDALGTVLIVEDDRIVIRALKRLFEWNGYNVVVCDNGALAPTTYRETLPDAIVLDLHLPGMSGIDVCRIIRSESQYVPIVILSAATDVTDKVVLLELGADDYVTKPFSPKELLARVRAAIRSSTPHSFLNATTHDSTSVDDFMRSQMKSNGSIELTAPETKIIETFLKNPGRVLSRRELLDEVYGRSARVRSRVLDQHIMNLRKKLEADPSHPIHFCTVYGSGYRFVP